ncbi:hypothetical protein HBI68_186240 [Parastagonospora nodorum]|nr:hypothetical protein HBI74_202610 [Parastagonospora nodorum]KAH5738221.1 hypothetical protein HBI20_015660 [Parastagonospora nodorum]KAH5990407.1 hypothetical protein HBI84_178060 [Parastagonospora nodorum]KAH6105418.1 hypothetical protein HBI69_185930 [Parastagonospora nodorum]KAH6149474.1 hypothetical protein HBI68_186240 [Parastagonospora nodorum]
MKPYHLTLALLLFILAPTHAMRNIINPKKSHAGEKCRKHDMSDCSWYREHRPQVRNFEGVWEVWSRDQMGE